MEKGERGREGEGRRERKRERDWTNVTSRKSGLVCPFFGRSFPSSTTVAVNESSQLVLSMDV